MRAAALIVWVSGNAVKTREEVTIDCESEVKVVEGSETVIGTAVVNVVRLENRDGDPEEVALAGMGEVDVGPLEVVVADNLEDVGIAEASEDVDGAATEVGAYEEANVEVLLLVVHHWLWSSGNESMGKVSESS